jgi:hypothetical protein
MDAAAWAAAAAVAEAWVRAAMVTGAWARAGGGCNSDGCGGVSGGGNSSGGVGGAAMVEQHGWVQPLPRRREELERLARERRFDGDFLALGDVKSRARSTC